MVRVELRSDLNMVVAGMVRSKVDRLAAEVEAEAARRAPAARVWLSREDERVRPSHVDAHDQTIPANLRFKLRKQQLVKGKGVVLLREVVLARKPRDPALPEDQVKNCRCVDVTVPGVIARRIQRDPAVVTDGRVSARVSVAFPRIVESEHGTDGDEASRFMGGAVDAVALRLRAYARRT